MSIHISTHMSKHMPTPVSRAGMTSAARAGTVRMSVDAVRVDGDEVSVYRHVYRHMYRHVCRNVYGRVDRHGMPACM